MITVLIAESNILELFDTYSMFLNPLRDKEKIVLCRWVKEGLTLTEMLPDIYEIIALHDEWRAIIITEDGLQKLNPFDFVQFSEKKYEVLDSDWSEIARRRNERFNVYRNALENPLTKLTIGLCGVAKYNTIVEDDELYNQILSGEISLYEYMLMLQLKDLNTFDIAKKLKAIHTKKLLKFVSESDVDILIEWIREKNIKEILNMIEVNQIVDFIRFIGDDDLLYSDSEYVNCIIENTYKSKLYEMVSKDFTFCDKLPVEVICVAPREFDCERYFQETKWKRGLDENISSSFAKWNMYPAKIKYILFDIVDKENKQYAFEQVRALCFLLLLAGNDVPNGVLPAERIYRANIEFNVSAMEKACSTYLAKLKSTYAYICEIDNYVQASINAPTEEITEEELMRSDMRVSADIPEEFHRDLYARFDQIGLSTDCPVSEKYYWKDQYHNINKKFSKYLREPKRALKSTVMTDFPNQNYINDQRIYDLTENQLEDISYKLIEEEERMILTNTVQMYNDAKYKDELDKADKEVQKCIGQRMTKKKTLLIGLVATLAYLIGFLPMLQSNMITRHKFVFSLSFTGIAVLIFMLIGFIFLFVLKHRLLMRFKYFNYVMYGICSGIEENLKLFSKYLNHASNVMRAFSVLESDESELVKKQKILKYHKISVVQKMDALGELFVKYVDNAHVVATEIDPYDYDFEVLRDYEFDMPYVNTRKNIDFLQVGNEIMVPIDYINTITLIREEFYD